MRKVKRCDKLVGEGSHPFIIVKNFHEARGVLQIGAVVTLFYIEVFLGFDCSRRQGLVNGGLGLIQKRVERIRVKWTPLCLTITDSLSPPTHFTIVGQLITHSSLLII